jgi:hypothetical protein
VTSAPLGELNNIRAIAIAVRARDGVRQQLLPSGSAVRMLNPLPRSLVLLASAHAVRFDSTYVCTRSSTLFGVQFP